MSGEDAYILAMDYVEETVKGAGAIKGEKGEDGKSAYEIWLGLGNTGSEQDFINSLKGEKGDECKIMPEDIEQISNFVAQILSSGDEVAY